MSRYIEVNDVANAIYHHFPSIRTMADARSIIEEAPSIDIEPKRGEWKHDGSVWTYRFNCTNCGYHLLGKQTNYCPNCGARMKGADDE